MCIRDRYMGTINLLCVEQEKNHQKIERLKTIVQSKDSEIERLRSITNLDRAQIAKLKSEKDELLRTSTGGFSNDDVRKTGEGSRTKDTDREVKQLKQMMSEKKLQLDEILRRNRELEETLLERTRKIEELDRIRLDQQSVLHNLLEENNRLRQKHR
eukprot:TRINITY_DN23223_c0_g1_i2.p1 TRINITY_DN23223_c0_g1~~TRINITY_DN23223_c0_g1_i2.p1  ORF type:complete len:157 (-),score=43.34 TRINITY_DN23223_c0_g1_i2:55-525(-)